MNILIHVQSTTAVEGSLADFSGVELTLDGVVIHQQTLIKTRKADDWTIYSCKVCTIETHGEQKELVMLSDTAVNVTDTANDLRDSASYSSAFNLVIPAEVKAEEDLGEVQAATGDILLLACSAERIKDKLQRELDKRVADFIRKETEKLRAAQTKVDAEKAVLSNIINTSYHAEMPTMLEAAMCDLPVERKEERHVMFNENPVSPAPHHVVERQKKARVLKPKAEVDDNADLFSFDLDSGVDNIDFLDEPEDDRSESESSSDESSGCEADIGDIDLTGRSVPINIPMGEQRNVPDLPDLPCGSMKDIAHSMKLIQNMYLQDQPDLPRHHSYNPRMR